MKEFSVSVGSDHIAALAKARKPLLGMLELIWNALDGDATRVKVTVTPNGLGGVETIEVDDDGVGIKPEDLEFAFGQLGDSWKKQAKRTRTVGRALHGKRGVGRYRAFSLGDKVIWETRFLAEGKTWTYTISLDPIDKRRVTATAPVETTEAPGTRVRIFNIPAKFESLAIEGARTEVTEHLALYLQQYPNVNVVYDGHTITPSELIKDERQIDFPFVAEDGTEHVRHLTIIEWRVQVDRALFLCSREGFSLRELPAGIHAPGLQFTAYLRSSFIESLEDKNALDIELGELGKLTAQAREKLRDYNLNWQAKQVSEVVAEWKDEEIYPFEGVTENPVEQAQRQVFDVVAVSVTKYLPGFKDEKLRNKRLTFNLLKETLETSPSSLRKILEEVLGLPKRTQDELALLLEKTSLSSIIAGSKIVSDRLEFIQGLRSMLFDQPYKDKLLERKQLQRLVAANTWLFGEEYFLMNDDESLLNVLRQVLGRKGYDIEDGTVDLKSEVSFEGGGTGVVDLALTSVDATEESKNATPGTVIGKMIPRTSGSPMHNLVIELKRPTEKISPKVLQEVRDYAFAIAKDERFSGIPARWTFWALSNELTEQAVEQANQRDRAPGIVEQSALRPGRTFEYTIISKTWGEVLDQASQRLEFFRKHLAYSPSFSQGRDYLSATYADFVPRVGDYAGIRSDQKWSSVKKKAKKTTKK